MSILALLILHANSAKNTPTFVILDKNHSISLSPAAEQSLGNSSVLILVTGSSPDKISLLNNLLLGPRNGPSPLDFFLLDDGTISQLLEFSFHPGIEFATFCRNWRLNCRQSHPNRRIIFILSPGHENERDAVARMYVALSSIITFPLYATAPWRQLLPNWSIGLDGPRGALLSATKAVNGGFVVVVPRPDIPGANRDSPAGDTTPEGRRMRTTPRPCSTAGDLVISRRCLRFPTWVGGKIPAGIR